MFQRSRMHQFRSKGTDSEVLERIKAESYSHLAEYALVGLRLN
jgi:hypothetical protein